VADSVFAKSDHRGDCQYHAPDKRLTITGQCLPAHHQSGNCVRGSFSPRRIPMGAAHAAGLPDLWVKRDEYGFRCWTRDCTWVFCPDAECPGKNDPVMILVEKGLRPSSSERQRFAQAVAAQQCSQFHIRVSVICSAVCCMASPLCQSRAGYTRRLFPRCGTPSDAKLNPQLVLYGTQACHLLRGGQ